MSNEKLQSLKIALLHYADVNNYGDILFPIITAKEIKKRLPFANINFVSSTGVGPEPSAIYNYDLLKRYDAIVVAGGEIIHRKVGMLQWIFDRLRLKRISDPTDIVFGWTDIEGPYKAWFGVGVPAFDGAAQKHITRSGQKLHTIVARGSSSKQRLREVGCTVAQSPDIGWLFPRLLQPGLSVQLPVPPYVLFHMVHAPSEGDLKQIIAQLKAFQVRGLSVVLLPLTTCWADEVILGSIAKAYDFSILDYRMHAETKLAVLANCSLYIGQSMHGFISALSTGRPAGLCYPVADDKFSEFLSDSGLTDLRVGTWRELPILCERLLNFPLGKLLQVRAAAVSQVDQAFDKLTLNILKHVESRAQSANKETSKRVKVL